ncbi:hypothetical protein Y032_0042g557 [Ancylostoma ceylanicum]|uniref:TIL domain-containing protein n=1 Tax=Ancylostoma ceylanicum TaxID=53326 RepID=A0A016UG44_9BILA|nr:hypothetical protein Y032_0042g557 [Ancylostoma ceylanicum]
MRIHAFSVKRTSFAPRRCFVYYWYWPLQSSFASHDVGSSFLSKNINKEEKIGFSYQKTCRFPGNFQYKKQCGENEEWTRCASVCQPSCATPSFSFCPLMCSSGCECNSGFYRNYQGKCVADCSSEPCPLPNEVRKKCGVRSHCQPTCLRSERDYLQGNCGSRGCVPFECECKPGYIRMRVGDKQCIPVAKCKKLRRRQFDRHPRSASAVIA